MVEERTTGIILRKGLKANFIGDNFPKEREMVFATDFNEVGMIINGELIWQQWNPWTVTDLVTTGSDIPEVSVGGEGDLYIRVFDELGLIHISEYKKENGEWELIEWGVDTMSWLDDNIEPNFHTKELYPFLGKYGYNMMIGYVPQEDLDVATKGYLESEIDVSRNINLNGGDEMDSSYIPIHPQDVMTHNQMTSGDYNIVIPTFNPHREGALWNNNSRLDFSHPEPLHDYGVLRGTNDNQQFGHSFDIIGDTVIVGSPFSLDIGSPYRDDHVSILDTTSFNNYGRWNQITVYPPVSSGTVYTRGFGSRILVVDNNRFIIEEGARYNYTFTEKAYVYNYSGNLIFESSSDFRGSCTDGNNIVFIYNRKRENVFWTEFQVFDSNNNLIRTFGEEVDNYHFSGGRVILQDGIIYFLDTNTGDYFLNMLNIYDSTYYGAINLDGNWPFSLHVIGDILYMSDRYRITMYDINTKLAVNEFDKFDLPDVAYMFYGNNFKFNADDNCFYIGCDGYRDMSGNIRSLGEMILVYSPQGTLLRQIQSPDSTLSGFGDTIHFLNGKLSASAPFSRRDQWNDFAGAILFNDTVTRT